MVRKLFKYEFMYYFRTLGVMYLVLLGLAVINRAVQFFESDATVYNSFFISSLVLFIIAIIVACVMTVIVAVARFYKNLYSCEGYLSFTLPVTPMQHLTVKVLSALVWTLITLLVAFIGGVIASSGEPLFEFFKAVNFVLKKSFEEVGVNMAFFILEGIVLFLTGTVSAYSLLYTCISVGQLSNKNRKLAAVGVFFGFYFVCQFFGLAFILSGDVLSKLKIFGIIEKFMELNPLASAHIGLCGAIFTACITTVIYTLITNLIMKKKLNLE